MSFHEIPLPECEVREGKIRFSAGSASTGWIDKDDPFTQRIDKSRLNAAFPKKHLIKEIEIKNIIDEGVSYLDAERYSDAVARFDEVLFYDPQYAEALIAKSHALYGQKHFVKALRYYRKAVRADESMTDGDYCRRLEDNAKRERDNFPKLKTDIYAGDECFSRGEFAKAVECYNRALSNPSKFKDRIIARLLNKKAAALLRLEKYSEALDCFNGSPDNDCALFGRGYCRYKLGEDVGEDFTRILKIPKRHMLTQVLVLNELEYFTQSLVICDYLMENHYAADDFYFRLLNARMYAVKSLDMNPDEINRIFDRLSK